MDLLERRAGIVRRHKTLASVPGSGWHKDDAGEAKRLARGEPALCDRVVALADDDRVHVVGPCVPVVLKGLADFLAVVPPPTAATPATEIHAAKVARRVVDGGGDALVVPSQEWNGCLYALTSVGVRCVLADARHVPDEEK